MMTAGVTVSFGQWMSCRIIFEYSVGEQSKIEWTDATWNPWFGCRKISPGCAYCYMDRWAKRTGRNPEKITRAKDTTFYSPLKWTEPKRIFTCSLSDFFIQEADEWAEEAWGVIHRTPQHTYLILTKRVERIYFHLPWITPGFPGPDIWPNVWLGVSVENQRQADERVPKLLEIPAALKFLSVEPLLGPITFRSWHCACGWKGQEDSLRGSPSGSRVCPNCGGSGGLLYHNQLNGIDWVIVGGESGGPEYRRLVEQWKPNTLNDSRWNPKLDSLEWVRSLRDQCQASEVPFFFKQWGGLGPKSGGRTLDGREWKEMPAR